MLTLSAAIVLSAAFPASAATKHHRVTLLIDQSITMFVGQFTTWWPPPSVAAVRHLVAQNAVALARGLALVHHQIEIDDVLGWAKLPELLHKH
jgi:hypothetical protein